jgi:predicted amidohydrolase
MGRTLRLLAAQVRPVAFDVPATIAKFEHEVRAAAKAFPEVDLLVFPELYLTGDDPFVGGAGEDHPESVAETIPGPLTDHVGKVAHDVGRWLAAGSIFERAGDRIHNTAVVFAPDGSIAGRYRKMFPWRPFEESAPGDAHTVVDVPGAGRIGVMICYDGWFPEVPRGLALAGAELILQPTLTATPDREEELILARANAIANQCFLVNVNAATTFGGGRSIGVDPEGNVLFECGQNEELVPVTVDLERVTQVREHGTRGLNRIWKHLHEAPPAAFEPYRRFLRDD